MFYLQHLRTFSYSKKSLGSFRNNSHINNHVTFWPDFSSSLFIYIFYITYFFPSIFCLRLLSPYYYPLLFSSPFSNTCIPYISLYVLSCQYLKTSLIPWFLSVTIFQGKNRILNHSTGQGRSKIGRVSIQKFTKDGLAQAFANTCISSYMYIRLPGVNVCIYR